MNIRNFYWLCIVVLSLGLLYEWTSEKRGDSIQNHLGEELYSSFDMGGSHVYIENNELMYPEPLNWPTVPPPLRLW